jgi:regulator of RNase E activity RraA
MPSLTEATRNKLKTISTATVATALFKRGLRIQMIQDVHPLGLDQPMLVGEAFTLRARTSTSSTCFATAPIRSARRSRIARPARYW